MAINLSDNIQTSAPKPTDSRYLCNLEPYSGVSQANSVITGGVGGVRYKGLTVNINGVEYWYKDDIGDGDLVLKTMGGTGVGTLTGATNGLSLVGVSGTTVSLGGGLTGNTIINISGKTLTFSGTTGKVLSYVGSSVNYNYSCIDANYITLEAGNGTNYVYYDINRSASTITTWTKGGNLCFSTEKISGSGGCMIISSPNAALFSGATYNGNYRSNFTSYSLVDKGYVDSRGNKICVCYPPTYNYEITDSVVGMIAVSGISTSECVLLPATSVPGIESGHRIIITDVCGNALSVPIIIDGNGKCINDNGCAMINTNNGSITFVYNGNFWSAVAFVN